ncbi:MAG: type II toxin-antitoxin system Phd/YefM family antitoxin [Actinomycetota bacterium]
MPNVTIRELSRNPSKIVDQVSSSGKPALVTKNGRVVAALVPIDGEALEDFVLAHAPEFVRAGWEAESDLKHGRTREASAFFDELERKARLGAPRRAGSSGAKRRAPAGRRGAKTGSPGARSTRAGR